MAGPEAHLLPPPHPYLDVPGVLALAHRCGGSLAPENTLAAVEATVGLGFRYVETDVHATADGEVVLLHDAVLDRVTDRRGRVERLPWREVSRARVHGTEPVPRLEDLLGSWPSLRVNIDVKSGAAVRPLVEILRRTNSLHRVCVASFSDRRLAAVRRALGPGLCTSLGPAGVTALLAASYREKTAPSRGRPVGGPLASLPRRWARCAQVPVGAGPLPLITPQLVDTTHRLGLQVHAWVVDSAAEMERLLHLGVDGLVSADVATLRRVLQKRGQWVPA